jgi:hypothetical protein
MDDSRPELWDRYQELRRAEEAAAKETRAADKENDQHGGK